MIRLFNSLSRHIEDFKPLNPPQVGMYTCGPTVYDYQHIGNLRTMLLSDTLRRVLTANGYKIKSVRNITDIDDKIIRGANERGLPIDEFSKEYTKVYFDDLLKLNILSDDVNPKATEHVEAMVKYIEVLLKKKLAYVEDDGSVYFDISAFPRYGSLSRIDKKDLKAGTRILSDEYTKDNVQDFALWKSVNPDEMGYDSPWGRGRPGWHIECSVMSQQYLGDTFDIHVGGIDLLFPHHENEIAQSEGKTGSSFVNYFVHGEFVQVEGRKMSKSLGNIYTLLDLEKKGFEPLSYRYLAMTAHYKDKLNFTWESLQAAQNTLRKLRDEIRLWEEPKGEHTPFWQKFVDAAKNDLGIPQAVGLLHEMVRSEYPTSSKAQDIVEMDKILGLNLAEFVGKPVEVPLQVQKLLEEREKTRQDKDFAKSDRLRQEIRKLGFAVEDTPKGQRIR